MDGQFFISLLNPALGLLLACAFLTLWLYQRDKVYVAVIALGYALSGVGFTLYEVAPIVDSSAVRVASNLCFLLAAACVAGAIMHRYERPVPYLGLGLLCTAGISALCWFLFVDPNLTSRIYSINFALGGIAILTAVQLATARRKHTIDHVIFGLSLLAAANFIVRTVVIVQWVGPYDNSDGFAQSVYWATVQLSHALISISLALSLIVATALDIVAQLKADSETDTLSALRNRRGFDKAAGAMLEECTTRNRHAALVIADLDHFKAINDTYGHATGDRVIIAFADLLKAAAGPDAIVARIGGEEFAVFMPSMTLSAARLFAEGVRVAYGATSIPGIADIPATASFGVSALWKDDKLINLLRRADEALYAAKRDGRDRVRIFPHAPDTAAGSAVAWTQ